MTLNPQALFFLLGAIQGLILSLAILFKSHLRDTARRALAAFILILTAQILFKVISKDWIGNYFSLEGILAYQIPFLFGPLLYFFVHASLSTGWRFERSHVLHLVPFLLTALFVLLFVNGINNDLQYVLPNNWLRGSVYAGLQLLSLGYYGYQSWQTCAAFEARSAMTHATQEKVSIPWLHQFIITATLIGSLTAIILLLLYNLYPQCQWIRFLLLIQGLFIYWITYNVITNPTLLAFSALPISESMTPTSSITTQATKLTPFKKYAHNHLSEEDALAIREKIVARMTADQLFLNAELSIDDFAAAVGESKHNISRVINEKLSINFFDFVNGYRVEKAKSLLADPKMNHFTIAAIAFECGFNSVSSFNIVFKKFEAVTPSAYKKQKQSQTRVA